MWYFTKFADRFDREREKAEQLLLKEADQDVDRWWGGTGSPRVVLRH